LDEADIGEADIGEADIGEVGIGEADVGEVGIGEARPALSSLPPWLSFSSSERDVSLSGLALGEADIGEAGIGKVDIGEARPALSPLPRLALRPGSPAGSTKRSAVATVAREEEGEVGT
jgi:hypothetical protein